MRNGKPNEIRMLGVEDVRETNELKLLHIIRDRQPISRADLVKETGLRAGTVSVIVNRLLRSSVIYQGEEAPSSGGRPATYLQINAEKAYVIGISIGVHQTLYGVSDFNGRILNQRSVRTEAQAETFLSRLADEIASLIQNNFGRAKLAGIGVSIPGLIDRIDGCLVTSPNLGWQDVPIRSILETKLAIPVTVENDANSAALSELWYGPLETRSAACVLFILIVEGIGTGLILNGEVYVGSRIGMGGFGHISVDPNGPPCSCGSQGCWEAVASDEATLKRYAESSAGAGRQASTLHDLIDWANAGDECAKRELVTTAHALGRMIRGLAHGLAPGVIVIGGQIAAAWPFIQPVIAEEVKSRYLMDGISRPEIRVAAVENPVFFGAFPVALRSVLLRRTSRKVPSN
jgi:predicted NBD/HSP70 family sugar kinase